MARSYTMKDLKARKLSTRKVGKAAGFSKTHVERALKGWPGVSQSAKAKIFEIIHSHPLKKAA